MSTDNLSKMTTLAELQGYAKGQGLDLKQAPKVEDTSGGRAHLRHWIRNRLAERVSKPEVKPTPVVKEQAVVESTPVVDVKAEELENPQTPTEKPTEKVEEQAVIETPVVINVEKVEISQPDISEKNPTKVISEDEIDDLLADYPKPEPEAVVKPTPKPVVVEKTPPEPKKETKKTRFPWEIIIILGILVVVSLFIWHPWFMAPTATIIKPTATPTIAPATATETLVSTTETVLVEETETVVLTDGKLLAESILGEVLPWPPVKYVAGGDGFPEKCSGLCWDKSKLDEGILVWYGPSDGSEDITQSDVKFGDGTESPIELMRSGQINTVIFANGLDAQMEVCAIPGSTLDGKLIADWLKDAGITEQCGRFAISAGWHVVKDNMNAPIAGFGVRLSASGWASMSESQIIQYNQYWTIEGNTATWIGPEEVEIIMVPSMVEMMQDFGSLSTIVFTTTKPGQILLCNGTVDSDVNLSSPDGSCQLFDVIAGTFTYHGEARLSAGVSWQPTK